MTPIQRAARALVLQESGTDSFDGLSDELQAQVIESVKAVAEAFRDGKDPSEIATQVVPQYISRHHHFDGIYARRWEAAYDAAYVALYGEMPPE